MISMLVIPFLMTVVMPDPPGSGTDIVYAVGAAENSVNISSFTGLATVGLTLNSLSSSGNISATADGFEAQATSLTPYSYFTANTFGSAENTGTTGSSFILKVAIGGGHWGGGSASSSSSIHGLSVSGGGANYTDNETVVVYVDGEQEIILTGGTATGTAGE